MSRLALGLGLTGAGAASSSPILASFDYLSTPSDSDIVDLQGANELRIYANGLTVATGNLVFELGTDASTFITSGYTETAFQNAGDSTNVAQTALFTFSAGSSIAGAVYVNELLAGQGFCTARRQLTAGSTQTVYMTHSMYVGSGPFTHLRIRNPSSNNTTNGDLIIEKVA